MPGWAELTEPGAMHDYVTVRELMHLENEQALAAARERRVRGGPATGRDAISAHQNKVVPAGADLQLVGIYGVGKRLFAEVRAGSQGWLFLRGHSAPVGRTALDAPYRLKEISGSCIRLEHQAQETRLCLSQAGRS